VRILNTFEKCVSDIINQNLWLEWISGWWKIGCWQWQVLFADKSDSLKALIGKRNPEIHYIKARTILFLLSIKWSMLTNLPFPLILWYYDIIRNISVPDTELLDSCNFLNGGSDINISHCNIWFGIQLSGTRASTTFDISDVM
jgi:hypothetical protein